MSKTNPPNPPSLPGRPRCTWLVPLWMRRHRHLTVPLLVVPAVFPAAGAILAVTHQRVPALIAGGVLALSVWFFAPHKWDRTIEQVYAVYTAAAAGGWLSIVAWQGFTLVTWCLGAALAVLWGVPWWWHKRTHLYSSSARLIRSWNSWWQRHSHLWDGQGSGVIDVDPRRDVEVLRVQGVAGVHTADKLAGWVPHVESALRGYVKNGMIRARVDEHDPSVFEIHLRRDNPLRGEITWDSAQVPASITQPAPLGKDPAGAWKKVCLLANWFFLGQTRWGKSNEESVFLATITGVPDARAWLIDMKGARSARPWMPALDWVATTIEEARIMLRCALAEVQGRAADAYDGNEQLTPTEEIPALFVFIDETHEVTSELRGDSECAALLAAISSLGSGVAVHVVVVTQHGALDTSVRTEQTRANLQNRLVFHVASARHGEFALEDWSKLNAARLDVKGAFFYQLGPDASVEEARGPHIPHDLVRQIAAANGARPRLPLRLFAGPEWQQSYDARWQRLPERFRDSAPQCANLASGPPPASAAAATATEATPPPAPAATGWGAEAAAFAAQVEADIAATPDVNPADLPRIPSDFELETETLRRMAEFARLLAAADPHITPNDLVKGSGMSRPWVMAMLPDLVEDDAVAKDARGQYRPVPGADIWAAIDKIRERRSKLPVGA